MRNHERRGDAMEHEELRTAEPVEDQTASTDLDTDDSDASDALEVIGREAEAESREMAPATLKTSPGASPFLLESLYFRSFGERALLTVQRLDRSATDHWHVVARELVLRQQLAHLELDKVQELSVLDHVALVQEHDQRGHADERGDVAVDFARNRLRGPTAGAHPCRRGGRSTHPPPRSGWARPQRRTPWRPHRRVSRHPAPLVRPRPEGSAPTHGAGAHLVRRGSTGCRDRGAHPRRRTRHPATPPRHAVRQPAPGEGQGHRRQAQHGRPHRHGRGAGAHRPLHRPTGRRRGPRSGDYRVTTGGPH